MRVVIYSDGGIGMLRLDERGAAFFLYIVTKVLQLRFATSGDAANAVQGLKRNAPASRCPTIT